MFDVFCVFFGFGLGFGAGHLANCVRISNISATFAEITQGLKNAYDEVAAELKTLKADVEDKR